MEALRLARQSLTSAERAQHYREVSTGHSSRVIRGVAVRSEEWDALDADAQFLVRIHALAATTRQHVAFSHAAAVALHGYPWVAGWPRLIDATAIAATGRSTTVMRVHAGPLREVEYRQDLPVTTLPRTVIDVARSAPFEVSLALMDAVLAGRDTTGASVPALTLEELEVELEAVPPNSGGARARTALRAADARSGSPGESVSRGTMIRAGVPRPELQQRFVLDTGQAFVDFAWPTWGVIGEFDGVGKYLANPGGLDAASAVVAEKWREDALRRQVRGFARWGWQDARSPHRLRGILNAAGVPLRPRAVSSTLRWYEPAER